MCSAFGTPHCLQKLSPLLPGALQAPHFTDLSVNRRAPRSNLVTVARSTSFFAAFKAASGLQSAMAEKIFEARSTKTFFGEKNQFTRPFFKQIIPSQNSMLGVECSGKPSSLQQVWNGPSCPLLLRERLGGASFWRNGARAPSARSGWITIGGQLGANGVNLDSYAYSFWCRLLWGLTVCCPLVV